MDTAILQLSFYFQYSCSMMPISVFLNAHTHIHTHTQSHYSLATAQQAYKSLVKIHEKNGEMYAYSHSTLTLHVCAGATVHVHECRTSVPCVLHSLPYVALSVASS